MSGGDLPTTLFELPLTVLTDGKVDVVIDYPRAFENGDSKVPLKVIASRDAQPIREEEGTNVITVDLEDVIVETIGFNNVGDDEVSPSDSELSPAMSEMLKAEMRTLEDAYARMLAPAFKGTVSPASFETLKAAIEFSIEQYRSGAILTASGEESDLAAKLVDSELEELPKMVKQFPCLIPTPPKFDLSVALWKIRIEDWVKAAFYEARQIQDCITQMEVIRGYLGLIAVDDT